jgi:hypothetical protein
MNGSNSEFVPSFSLTKEHRTLVDYRTSVLKLSFVLITLSIALLLNADYARAVDSHDAPSWFDPGLYPTTSLSDSVRYDIRVHQVSRIGMTITNYGFLGNNFVNRSPSLEYPLGSTIDHLIRAGMWFGAINPQGDTLVTTGAIDGYYNTPSSQGVEFAPATRGIEEVSALPNSKYYSKGAYSEQDFIAFYSDSFPNGVNPPKHVPLYILVKQRSMVWSYELADAFVLIDLTLKNISGGSLGGIYLGMYSELASGNKGSYATWPPSGWFYKKDITYYDSLRMVSEHHYTFDKQPATGVLRAPSWAGIKFLGAKVDSIPVDLSTKQISFNWWGWSPSATDKDQDFERYLLMKDGLIVPTAGSEAPLYDAVELISVGPINDFRDSLGNPHPFMSPTDSIEIAFAFIGGDNESNLIKNASWAQKAYDFNFVLPQPPPSPILKVVPGRGKVALYWDASPEIARDPVTHDQDFEGYRVYLSTDNETFDMIRQVDIVDSAGFNTGLQQLEYPGPLVTTTTTTKAQNGEDSTIVIPLKYRLVLDDLKDGFKYWASVTSYDSGTPEVPSLESGKPQNKVFAIPGPEEAEARASKVMVFPNPYRVRALWDREFLRDRYLWFTNLPRKATIRIYSLAGDLVDEIDFDGDTYRAEGARGIYDPNSDPEKKGAPLLSGSMYAWDVISNRDQAIATGLYIFVVEDKTPGSTHGKTQTGKFLVIK